MIKVLFVCSGNICRSPMADAVFQNMVNQAGLGDKIYVDSAGTGPWHVGELAHSGTRKVLKKHGIDYRGRSRQIQRADMSDFDYVLAMDSYNMAEMKSLVNKPKAELAMFLSYAQNAKTTNVKDVPDPYYTGGFDRVYELVEKGSAALLDHIRAEHNL
jgi:protein-tyrosine phosphatase